MKSIKNTLNTGQIEMKGYPDSSGVISFQAIAKKITIDWGDGNVDEFTPNGVERTYTYEYRNSNFQTILLYTENLTFIGSIPSDSDMPPGSECNTINPSYKYSELKFGDCPNLEHIKFPYNKLTVLDIKKASVLNKLDCYVNSLTTLSINGCKVLQTLNCYDNQLTTEKVNKIFESLPTISTKPGFREGISKSGNPGSFTCNRSIATNKGWDVYL